MFEGEVYPKEMRFAAVQIPAKIGMSLYRPRVLEAHNLSNPRQTNKVSAVWGGAAPYRQPRHADRIIVPDRKFAAEEPEGSSNLFH